MTSGRVRKRLPKDCDTSHAVRCGRSMQLSESVRCGVVTNCHVEKEIRNETKAVLYALEQETRGGTLTNCHTRRGAPGGTLLDVRGR
jgi:hypothetical protein